MSPAAGYALSAASQMTAPFPELPPELAVTTFDQLDNIVIIEGVVTPGALLVVNGQEVSALAAVKPCCWG